MVAWQTSVMLSTEKGFCLQAGVKPLTRISSAKELLSRVPVRGLSQHHTGLGGRGVRVSYWEVGGAAVLPLRAAFACVSPLSIP